MSEHATNGSFCMHYHHNTKTCLLPLALLHILYTHNNTDAKSSCKFLAGIAWYCGEHWWYSVYITNHSVQVKYENCVEPSWEFLLLPPKQQRSLPVNAGERQLLTGGRSGATTVHLPPSLWRHRERAFSTYCHFLLTSLLDYFSKCEALSWNLIRIAY